MARVSPGVTLVGRRRERSLLAGAAEAAARGESRVLVLRGPPGSGKTALLDDLAAGLRDATVLRATAVETESALPFAGLHELVRPVLGELERLPAPQASALAGALAMAPPGPVAERFTVYAAVLSLLAAAAEQRPLVALVDDAHWLDTASAEALAFAARRLDAEDVALVLAVREPPPSVAAARFPEVELEPLDVGSLKALLEQRV